MVSAIGLAWWIAGFGFPQVVPDPIQKVRAAVERSLPFIEKKGVEWMRDRKCTSCHQVTFMLWSHREALEHGIAVDAKKLDVWTEWSIEYTLTTKTDKGERGGGIDTMAQLLLARGTNADPRYREIADLMLVLQKEDGHFDAGGQLPSQRRPKNETNEVTTQWVLLALQSLPSEEALKSVQERAATWLADRKPGKSNESLALAALFTRSDELLQKLLESQNDDGGWSWLIGEASDALATGQTLYLLGRWGAAVDPQRIQRARDFLIKTQREDGSWKVASTKAKPKNDDTSTYWGTCWAAIGLLRTLPK
jgi:hypothetical protein